MTGTPKTANRTAVRLAGVALVAAMAGSSAIASEGSQRFVVAAYESTFVAAVSLDGCAPSTASRAACATTVRALSGTAAGLPCKATAVYFNGSNASGICSLGWANRAGTAKVTVSNSGCEQVVVRDPRASRITLVDGMGVLWRVVDFRLDAGQYIHEAVDNWTLRTISGVTDAQGSYVRAVNGKKTLVAWLNGTMTAVGWCFADAGSGAFTLNGVAQGWIIQ